MIDYESMRSVVAKGLRDYLQCSVRRSNQNEEPPDYPYVLYTITTLASENKGTYGEYSDGQDRKPTTQTWSITAYSDKSGEDVTLIMKAHEWLEYVGSQYLNDRNVIVQSVTNITNRSNILTTEYEYSHGFDCVFWIYDEIAHSLTGKEYIEEVKINGTEIKPKPVIDWQKKYEELAAMNETLNKLLQDRLNGVIG